MFKFSLISGILGNHQYQDTYGIYNSENGSYQNYDILTGKITYTWLSREYGQYAGTYTTPRQNYQYTMNYDYSSYDTYSAWKPSGSDYHSQNAGLKVNTFTASYECGDCLRGGYIYCTPADIFGSEYTGAANKPAGACCIDKDNCPEMSNAAWSCSDKYADNY